MTHGSSLCRCGMLQPCDRTIGNSGAFALFRWHPLKNPEPCPTCSSNPSRWSDCDAGRSALAVLRLPPDVAAGETCNLGRELGALRSF